jgi:hypothetical protein
MNRESAKEKEKLREKILSPGARGGVQHPGMGKRREAGWNELSPQSPTIVRAFARAIRQHWRWRLMMRVAIRYLRARDRPMRMRNALVG